MYCNCCRFNRVGSRVKSELDMEEVMDNLQEQALEDKKMRSYAVIPPILLDAKERRATFHNNNGHVVDMEQQHKSRQYLNVWTPSEKEIFREKYLQHPKNFGAIASCIERKSVMDCVQYYYLSKKTENYKQLLRKSRQRTRSSRNNPQKTSNAITSVVDSMTTGVTTRLQREQQQKIVVQQNRDIANSADGSASSATTTSTTTSVSPPTVTTASTSPLTTTTATTTVTTCATVTPVSSTLLTTSNSTVTTSTTPSGTTTTTVDSAVTDVAMADPPTTTAAKINDFNSFEDAYRGKKFLDEVKTENGVNGAGNGPSVEAPATLNHIPLKKEPEDPPPSRYL